MTLPQEPERAFARVERNATGGRDFVVGDVHGEFDTLEAMLASVGFLPGCDRLFALGDLIDRGPRSVDAVAWMERGRIALSVRGNHEQMLLERMQEVENNPDDWRPLTMHPWFTRDVPREQWARWQAMLHSMPLAVTSAPRPAPSGWCTQVQPTGTGTRWSRSWRPATPIRCGSH